jgi:hypothetical protein
MLGSCLMRDQTLTSSDALIALTTSGKLRLQGPGGLIWTPPGVPTGVPTGAQGNRACITADGAFRLLNSDGDRLWGTAAIGSSKGPYVVMATSSDDLNGQLEIRDVDCTVRWATPAARDSRSSNTSAGSGSGSSAPGLPTRQRPSPPRRAANNATLVKPGVLKAAASSSHSHLATTTQHICGQAGRARAAAVSASRAPHCPPADGPLASRCQQAAALLHHQLHQYQGQVAENPPSQRLQRNSSRPTSCSARGLPLSSALLLPSERSCADLSGMCLTGTVPQLHMRCWPVHRQVVRLGSRLGSCPWRLCVQVASLLPVHLFLARSDASLNGGNYGKASGLTHLATCTHVARHSQPSSMMPLPFFVHASAVLIWWALACVQHGSCMPLNAVCRLETACRALVGLWP